MPRNNANGNPPLARAFYTVREVAEVTGMKYSTLNQLIRGGALAHTRLGKTRLIPVTEIDRLLRECEEFLANGRSARQSTDSC